MSKPFDAVVLAGGRATRLGGIDKALVSISGGSLLDRVLAALTDASRIVCVGPERPTAVPVAWTRERPAGGGPVAAVAAALPLVTADTVIVMSVDAAFITAPVVGRLVDACRQDGALLVDADGRAQPLMAAYRTTFLRDRIVSLHPVQGAAMHAVIEGAGLASLEEPRAARDIDTPDDLEAARSEIGQ